MYKNGTTKEAPTPEPIYSTRAEQAVLGSFLMDPQSIADVSDKLMPNDFFLVGHQHIYETLRDLFLSGRDIDILTIHQELISRGHGDLGQGEDKGEGYLITLINEVPTSYHVKEYSESIIDLAIRRRMLQTASTLANMAHDRNGNLLGQLDAAENKILALRGNKLAEHTHRPHQYVGEFLTYLDEMKNRDGQLLGLPSGWPDLDKLTYGFQPGQVYYIAARPGMGKSSMLINMATHWTMNLNKRVAFFSLEMTANQLTARIMACETGIPLVDIKRGKLTESQQTVVYQAAARLSESRLIYETQRGITPSQLRSKVKRHHAEQGLDAVIVDYIGLMRPDRQLGNKVNEVGEISHALTELAGNLDIPVIVASQLNRAVEGRADKRPMLADLRDSGDLEQDAYAVMFIYRDDYYDDMSMNPNMAEVELAKHRDGPTGKTGLYWKAEITAFKSLETRKVTL